MFQSAVSKWRTFRMIIAIYQAVPTTSVAKFQNLSKGSHIKMTNTPKHTDHAIVTDLNMDTSKITIIKCLCKDINTPESKAEIKEEIIELNEDQTVFLVNYKDKNMDLLMPQFRIPQQDSVKVAKFFKENSSTFDPELMKDCEHFALCCTTGYPINFRQMNLLLIAFGVLKIFDKNVFTKMMDQVKRKRRISYDKEGKISVMTQPEIYVSL